MLILLDRIGWRSSLVLMSAIVLLAGIPLLKHQEKKIAPAEVKPSWISLISFFKRDKMIFWAVLPLVYVY